VPSGISSASSASFASRRLGRHFLGFRGLIHVFSRFPGSQGCNTGMTPCCHDGLPLLLKRTLGVEVGSSPLIHRTFCSVLRTVRRISSTRIQVRTKGAFVALRGLQAQLTMSHQRVHE